MKTNRTIRFSPVQLALAEEHGINVNDVCRAALTLEIYLRGNSLTGERKNKFILNFFAIRSKEFTDDLETLVGKKGRKK